MLPEEMWYIDAAGGEVLHFLRGGSCEVNAKGGKIWTCWSKGRVPKVLETYDGSRLVTI